MTFFLIIVILHWLEHLVQLGQLEAGVHRACASGFLGYFFPQLVAGEWLHFGYALVMLVGLLVLWRTHWTSDALFTLVSRKGPLTVDNISAWRKGKQLWLLTIALQSWHFFEHSLLFVQVQAFGIQPPSSLLQLVFPRIELHLFYNTLVTIPMILALYQRRKATR